MRFKFIVVFVEDALTEAVAEAAKDAGATGCTRINSASGASRMVSSPFGSLKYAVSTTRQM